MLLWLSFYDTQSLQWLYSCLSAIEALSRFHVAQLKTCLLDVKSHLVGLVS